MRNISQEELNKILKEHELWLKREGGKCADLSDVDLRCADLTYANLRCADLKRVNLKGAYLRRTNLGDADLENANLECADLRFADLENANLKYANLEDVNFKYVDLSNANLGKANLSNADLKHANLVCTDLRYADLRGADLRDANLKYGDLRYANLEYVKTNIHTIGYNLACPKKGSFIGYKKANGCIVKLLIPEDAKRSSATTTKCRTNKAKVLDIENIKTGEKVNSVCSNFDNTFIYKVGEIVSVDNFDDDRWNECSAGIHFFVNKERAINY